MGITNRFATEDYVETGLNEKITIPSQAAVGQVISVKEVDESGIPIEWEMVDMPSGESDVDINKELHERGILAYSGDAYNNFSIELENYGWNHLAGTKYFAPLVENATLFTTENATAHEAHAAGFNGNWFLFQWVQNTAGTTTDMQDINAHCEIQGKLMYWRYGSEYGLTSQSNTFTISKKNDVITRTVAGDTITASGGVGVPNIAKKDASTTIYSIATYYHNGNNIPTTREISIIATDYTADPNSNLNIGAPTMWTITKNGVKYDWNDTVLGTEYGGHVNCQIYCDYANTGYNYYMAVVRPNAGISIITSTDCTNWTFVADVDIPVDNTAYIETAFTKFANRWYLAVRCKDGRLWVAKLMTDYTLNWNFFIPDCGSKPQFVTFLKELILVCAPQSRYSCRLYRFSSATKDLSRSEYPNRIEAVADITYNACNYPFFVSSHDGRPNYTTYTGVPNFICLGTNNFITNKQGCSYFIAEMPVNGNWQYPNEAVNALAATDSSGGSTSDITVDSELSNSSENPVQNKVITAELKKMVKTVNGVAPDANGNIQISSSGSVAGLTSEQISALDELFKIATYTVDSTNAYAAFKVAFGISDGGEDEPTITIPDGALINLALSSYDGGGTIVNDGSGGSAYNATVSGNPTTIADGLKLNTADNFSVSKELSSNTSWTWFVSARIGEFSTQKYQRIMRGNTDVPSVYWSTNYSQYGVKLTNSATSLSATEISNLGMSTEAGGTNTFAFVCNGQTVDLYINGNFFKSEDSNIMSDNDKQPANIGCGDNGNQSYYFNALDVKAFVVYERALTADEISTLHNATV